MKKQAQDQAQNYMNLRRSILNKNSSFYIQEAYKTLRTNVRFFLRDKKCKKFCITSSNSGEGKSITMLNLAISFAEAGQKVLLIDADMRRPSVARLLVEKAAPGLSNVLAEMCTEEEAIRKDVFPNLDIIFSGDIPPNPSELLSSPKMVELLDKLSEDYDYILVDAPPVNVVSDVCVVAEHLDGVLYLVRQNKAEKDEVRRGVEQLKYTGVKLMGFVLNGVTVDRARYSEYKYKGYDTNRRRREVSND